MGVKDHFCCGLNTRRGTLISAFFTLFTSMICMSLTLLRFSTGTQKDMKMGLSAIVYGSLAVYSLLIIISFVAIAGATLDRRGFLLIWLLFMVLVLVFEAMAIVAQLVFLHPRNWMLQKWDIFNIVFYTLRTVTQLYGMVCVTIQYHALSTGTGTRQYFQKKKEIQHSMTAAAIGDDALDTYSDSWGNDFDSVSHISLDEKQLQSVLLEEDPTFYKNTKGKVCMDISLTKAGIETTYEFADDLKT